MIGRSPSGSEAHARERRIHIVQGQHHVTSDPTVVLTTSLGSCVAACLRDPLAGVGGMNHFLLPEGGDAEGPEAFRYGAYAMELLLNGLYARGARRERLIAKLFGGARLAERFHDIGGQNVAFARGFLRREGIALDGGSVRGAHARRIQFWPVSGRVRQLRLVRGEVAVFAAEVSPTPRADWGEVELFE
ncbi:MAG TPA: chemotaxis protein CheD [Caulobacteraceae bacterium]|nr:chemotaxis protein CheD [Caulobacteraceae bacterium]